MYDEFGNPVTQTSPQRAMNRGQAMGQQMA